MSYLVHSWLICFILAGVRCYDFDLNFDVNLNFRDIINNLTLNVAVLSKLQNIGLLTSENNEISQLVSLFNFEALENKLEILKHSLNNVDRKESCLDDILITLEAATRLETWALELIDSIPKIDSGLLDGNLRWMGSFTECVGVLQKTQNQRKIQGKFCWIAVTIQNEQKSIPFLSSICVPKTCSEKDIRSGISSLAEIFKSHVIPSKLRDVNCVQELDISSNSQIHLGIVLCAAFLIFIILGTIKDIYFDESNLVTLKESHFIENFSPTEGFQRKIIPAEASREEIFRSNQNAAKCVDASRLDSVKVFSSLRDQNQDPGQSGLCTNILLCFSLSKNGNHVFDFSEDRDSLPVVNGIRVLSLIWIIVSQTLICTVLILSNLSRIVERKGSVIYTLVQQWMLSFDSLLLVSGCLTAFNFMNRNYDGTKKFQLFRFYAKRYFRYTPGILVLVFIFYVCFHDWTKQGPFSYFYTRFEQHCAEDFWKNFFYLHNFQDGVNMCPLIAWYFDIETQLFLFSPVLLLLFLRSKSSTILIGLLVVIGSSVITGYLTVFYDARLKFDFEQLLLESPRDTQSLLSLYSNIYFKPYCRVSCYVIGLICGYLLFLSQGKNSLNVRIVVTGWISSLVTIFAVVFMFNITDYEVKESAIYLALSRPAWGLALAWIIYASSTGNGGLIGELLSWNFWAPFSRMAFSIYMSQFIFELGTFGVYEKVEDISSLQLYLFISTSILMSIILGTVIHLVFEAPLKNLAKLFLKDFKLTDQERLVKSS